MLDKIEPKSCFFVGHREICMCSLLALLLGLCGVHDLQYKIHTEFCTYCGWQTLGEARERGPF